MLHCTMINTNMWMLYLTVAILPVIQIHCAPECSIQSATSPTASSLIVVWDPYPNAVMYKLVLRVIDSTDIAPVIVNNLITTEKRVEGLKPAHNYTITLTVLGFLSVELSSCQFTSMTVPDIVRITSATALSSSSLRLVWDNVTGADAYTVHVDLYDELGQYVSNIYTSISTMLSEEVTGLIQSTTYQCYITASNVAGSGAKGLSKSVRTLVPPPTDVNITATGNSTARLTWTARSEVLQYEVTVTDSDTSNPPVIEKTSATHMDISHLEPCSTYTVGVASLNSFSLPGEPNEVSHTTSNINPVTTLSQQYNCTTATTTVTWGHVFGANSYRATVTDGSGESLNCTSNSTSCDIGMLKCGEKYTVRVTVISDDCSSTSTISKTFDTMPCAPANPTPLYAPFSSVIVFQYEPTNNTIYYITQSTDKNNKMIECRTTRNECYFTDVTCGQTYTFTVQAIMSVDSECTSGLSEPQVVITAPCSPTQVQTSSECTLGKLMTSWDAAAGAQNYTVTVLGNIGNYSCTTQNTSCEVTGIPCGEHATVMVTASNEVGTTDEILAPPGATVPCPPTNVSASIDCSDNATISWGTSKGAIYYIVVTEDSSGSEFNVHRTLDTEFVLQNLTCGETYTATVIGSNFQCNNSHIANVTFAAAPCPPTNVMADRDCNNNQATITWDHQATTGSYTAVLEDNQSGAKFNCSSTNTKSCTVSSPPCGKTYAVTVVYDSGSCPSTSAAASMVSGPCEPTGVTASNDCSSGNVTITWLSSDGADEYTATVTSGSRVSESCTSSSPITTCSVSHLACGQDYQVSVTASDADCNATSSEQVTQATAPCAPTNVNAVMDCSTDSATVTWDASDGANIVEYTVTGQSAQGSVNCNASGLICSLTNVQCGTEYSLQVVATDSKCTSDPSSAVTLTTAPCPPENVNATIDCATNDLTVSWTPSAHTERYLVSATAQNGGSDEACNITNSPCSINSVSCGNTYVAQVTAVRGSCHSQPSATASVLSEPCVPQNLAVAAYTVGVAQVQWSAAAGTALYLVEAVADQSTSVSNTSTIPLTELTGLVCGKTYNITVTANNDCDLGPTSQQIQLKTEPCPPTNVHATVQCGQQSATVSWTLSENAEGYVAFLQNSQGHNIVCDASSAETSCEATGLQCGTEYTVSAIAVCNPYNSSSSSDSSVTAEPCVPSNINVSVDCEAGVTTISWQPSEGALLYVAELGSSDHNDTCTSSNSSCQLSHLHCGEEYNASVTAVGESCKTIGHMAANFYTEPCEVTGVTVTYTVGSALVQWNSTKGATSYSVSAVTDQGAPTVCNSSSSTQCTVSGLQCSELYNVTVSAHNQACDSQGVTSDTEHLTTEPCPPTNIQAAVVCGQLQVAISWDLSVFAVGYIAYIADAQGVTSYCEGGSSDTSCVISGLVCSSIYNAWVVAKGTPYNSSSSSVIPFTSEPCLPQTITAQADCNSDGGTVSWSASTGDSVSVSHLVNGSPETLCTSDQNSCVVSGLSCGQTYSLILDVTNAQCTLPPQTLGSLSTRPCEPTGVTASNDCSSGNVTITWLSSDGADEYTATVTSGSGASESCTSPSPTTTCSVSHLACGQDYQVSVTASNADCNVTSSEQVTQSTAPCAPTNVNAVMDCSTDSATVTWDASDGANIVEYTVTGQSAQGSVNCNASGLICSLTNVQCGTEYSLQVVATDSKCTSDPSSAVTLTTAPCPPENVNATIDCATNDLTVSWTPSAHTERYLVSATAQNGGSDEACNITNSPCSINSVSCGNTYVAQVTAVRGSCHSQPSATASVLSAPCQPQNVSGFIDCVRNSARVSWNSALGADSYKVLALGERDLSANCTTSTNTTCEIELECATHYNFTVTATNSQCESPASAHIDLETAPCSLTGIRAHTQCHNSTILVEWVVEDGGTGDTVYTATAEDSNNNNISCNSSGNSCYLQSAQCGLRYTIMVSATSDTCNDLRSPPHHITTEPCQPDTPVVDDTCGDTQVSWTLSPIAEMYHVFAVGDDGHQHTCNTTFNNCTFQLHCNEQYSLYVVASHENCSSLASQNATLHTGPCKPDNVLVTYDCENSSALLTWNEQSNAASYCASAEDESGAMLYCKSNTATCTIEGLQCGSKYNFTVLATDGTCNSSYSDPIGPVGAVPCPPGNVSIRLLPDDETLSVSWLASDCNNPDYFVTLTGSIMGNSQYQFYISSYWTRASFFELPVHCGSDYNATVEARNSAGKSDPSTAISGSTATCPQA